MANESLSSDTDKEVSSVTIGDVTGGIHGSIIAGRDVIQTITKIFGWGPSGARDRRNKLILLKKVETFWVKGVLEKSLHSAALIELGKEEQPEAVAHPEHPWDIVLALPDQQSRPLPPGKKIIDIFNEMGQALLILGAPGSGKTITLLELGRDIIAHAKEDPTQPIPVPLNLSSWTDRRQSLIDWVVEELHAKYQIPKEIGRTWVKNSDLLLLLDGLDEVEPAHRTACVEAINQFRQEYGLTPLAICSRVAEYHVLATRLMLEGAIFLQPLTVQQINAYLAGAGLKLASLRVTLEHDATLQELAQSPLMLSVMTLAYQDVSTEALEAGRFDSTEARRTHIFAAYVAHMFKHRRADWNYTPEQTITWLSWLAQKIAQHNQSEFSLEQLQPSWLATRAQRRFYFLSSRLIGAFIIGLCFVLIGIGAIFIDWYLVILLFLQFLPLCFLGLLVGLVDGWRVERRRPNPTVNPARKVSYWQPAASILITCLIAVLGYELLFLKPVLALMLPFPLNLVIVSVIFDVSGISLFIPLLFGLFFGLRGCGRSITRDIQTVEGINWSWKRFVPVVVIGGILGGITFVIAAMTQIPPATLRDATGNFITSFEGYIGDEVWSAQINRDSTRILIARKEGVQLWEGRTGRLITTLAKNIKRYAFSPDGTRVLTLGPVDVAQLWDAQTGKLITSLKDIPLSLFSSWFLSADASQILASNRDFDFIQLWDAQAGTLMANIKGDRYRISPDWMRILTASKEGVQLWEGRTGRLIATLTADIERYTFSPDGTRILTLGRDDVARLWDAQDGTLISPFKISLTELLSSKFSCREQDENGMRFIVTDTRRLSERYNDLIRFNRDSSRMLTASKEGVQLWEGRTGRLIATLTADIERYTFSPDGTRILTLGRDDVARLWDAQDGTLISPFKISLTELLSSKFSCPEQDESDMWFIVDPERHNDLIRFNRDSSRMLTASKEGVQLWEGRTGRLIATLTKDREMGQFGPNGRRILTFGAEGVRLWDGQNGQLIATLTKADAYDFSPDGTRVVTVTQGDIAQLWDAKNGTLITTINNVSASRLKESVIFSPDGTRLVIITEPSRVRDYLPLAVAWLPLALLIGLLGGVRANIRETKSYPNQGVWLSARNAVLVGLIGGLSVVPLPALILVQLNRTHVSTFPVWLGLLVFVGVLTALWYGGLDVIQHFILRLILSYKGYIPWNYAHFLDYAAERIILRKVGGGYIFIHRLLLEYFAALVPDKQ